MNFYPRPAGQVWSSFPHTFSFAIFFFFWKEKRGKEMVCGKKKMTSGPWDFIFYFPSFVPLFISPKEKRERNGTKEGKKDNPRPPFARLCHNSLIQITGCGRRAKGGKEFFKCKEISRPPISLCTWPYPFSHVDIYWKGYDLYFPTHPISLQTVNKSLRYRYIRAQSRFAAYSTVILISALFY